MFMAAGVCAFDASIFHVFTHAFFMAVLFLGAGAVIHSLAGEQDMRRMGGLINKTPVTACVMIFAFLAIVGFPGFAGFWSKDLILERIFVSGPILGPIVYVVGLATAVITAVYMGRLIIMTFFGKYRGSKESEEHIHEAPAVMLFPMVILAFGAIFSGYLWADSIGLTFVRDSMASVVGHAQALYLAANPAAHVNPVIFAALGTLAALGGMYIAWKVFSRARIIGVKGASTVPEGSAASWTFLWDYIHCAFIAGVNILAWFCDVVVEKVLQAIQWTIAAIVEILGDGASILQVRKVRLQLSFSVAGVALLVMLVIFSGGLV